MPGASPRFRSAVMADARLVARHRFERHTFSSRLDALMQVGRLCWSSDAFGAQVLHRARVTLRDAGVPLLPRLCHRLAVGWSQVSIGDPVSMAAGIYVVHGQVVIDGLTTVGEGAVIAPFVTIGLAPDSLVGPTVGRGVRIGTGAKLIGPIQVGDGAVIGANAVVIDDVAAGTTVAGVPARPTDA